MTPPGGTCSPLQGSPGGRAPPEVAPPPGVPPLVIASLAETKGGSPGPNWCSHLLSGIPSEHMFDERFRRRSRPFDGGVPRLQLELLMLWELEQLRVRAAHGCSLS